MSRDVQLIEFGIPSIEQGRSTQSLVAFPTHKYRVLFSSRLKVFHRSFMLVQGLRCRLFFSRLLIVRSNLDSHVQLKLFNCDDRFEFQPCRLSIATSPTAIAIFDATKVSSFSSTFHALSITLLISRPQASHLSPSRLTVFQGRWAWRWQRCGRNEALIEHASLATKSIEQMSFILSKNSFVASSTHDSRLNYKKKSVDVFYIN